MGAHLIAAALMHRDVPHAAMRTLLVMATTAHDQEDPRRGIPAATYWGGREYLAEALGYAPDDPAGRRTVARHIATLVHMGLLKPCGSPGGGRGRQRYELTL